MLCGHLRYQAEHPVAATGNGFGVHLSPISRACARGCNRPLAKPFFYVFPCPAMTLQGAIDRTLKSASGAVPAQKSPPGFRDHQGGDEAAWPRACQVIAPGPG